jgi:cellulose synthase (UDP-forming)
VFREFQPETGVKIRKQVRAIAQLYWEGWEGRAYTAVVTEIGIRDIRLEFQEGIIPELAIIQQTRPQLGLLIARDADSPFVQSLVAEVENVEGLIPVVEGEVFANDGDQFPDRVVMELSFPAALDRQQHNKIKQLLKALD